VGRIGRSVTIRDAHAALRLATQNALASARATVGPLTRYRCVVLTAFIATATPEGLDPALLDESLALLAVVLPASPPPAIWLRPAQGLAGGMPVEVELLLEAPPRRGGEPASLRRAAPRRGPAGPGAGRARRRSVARTS
jgi:hypothetical protein